MKLQTSSTNGSALKILILKPSSLGDVVLALPVLRLLKRQFPNSQIYWWIDSNLAGLLEGDPDLEGLLRFERQQWATPRYWRELLSSIRWMREQAFDWVIDLQGLMRSGVFAWLANGGLTIGLDESREGAPAFYDLIVRQPRHAHALDCYLAVLPALGVAVDWDFTWLPERPEVASAVRNQWGLDKGRWVILQPGARWVNKRWPAEHFAQLLGLAAAARPDLRFAVLGSAEDQQLAHVIASASSQRCLDLTGKLSLPEMVECIRLSELMVTNDTGPMHVAAALGKPVVALFGPTDPNWTGPYGQLEHVMQLSLPCVPCRKSDCTYVKKFECLRGITPEAVFKAVLARLKSSGE